MIFIGGVYDIADDSLKVTTKDNGISGELGTFGSLSIDSPHKDRVSSVTLEFVAGDVAYAIVTYYDDNGKVTWTDKYTIKKDGLNISFQSERRESYSEEIIPDYENKRKKALGII